MIITDEELLALLNSEETDERLFHPVTIYALDVVAYRTAKAVELPEFATLRRTRPDACWQWEGLFAAGAIALFDPDSHVGADYLPQLTAQAEGVYRLTDDWLAGVNGRYLAWQEWLAQTQVLLLEDHPFQGAHIQQEIKGLGVPCQWVQDGNACIKALAGGEVKLLVSDLSLVEQDAISLLMSQPQYQHSGLPIVLLSAHDQTLIDGARRLLHDAGFNVLAALAKPLLADDLLRLLKTLYLGPQRQRRLSGLRRTIRTWQGEEKGLLGLLSDPPSPLPIWLAVTGLPPRWERVREWLVQQGREPGELT
ncbi:MAG: response regulator, partial [Aeromonas hydrophila]|nr:response regulator [Aeromonas hydrophila]